MFEPTREQDPQTDTRTLTPQSPDSANPPFEDTAEKMGWLHNPWVRRIGAAVAGIALIATGWRIGTANSDKQPTIDTAPNQPPVSAAPQTPGPEVSTSASPEALTELGFPIYADPELATWGLDRGTNRGKDGQWLYTPDTFPYTVDGKTMSRRELIAEYTIDTTRYPTIEDAAKAFVEVSLNAYVRAGNSTTDIERVQGFISDSTEAFSATSTDGRRGGTSIAGWAWPAQREILVASVTGMGEEGTFSDIPEGIRDESALVMVNQEAVTTTSFKSIEAGANRISRVEGWSNNPAMFKENPENMGRYEPKYSFTKLTQNSTSDPWAVTITFRLDDNLGSTDKNGNPDVIPKSIDLAEVRDSAQEWTLTTRLTKTGDGTAWKFSDKVEWSVKDAPRKD